MLNAVVITVSDSAFADSSVDLSGPDLQSQIQKAFDSATVRREIVPDDAHVIRATVERYLTVDTQLVITTGGTGFGTRDVTPEALAPFIDKAAPGLVALMINSSLQITPMAALSRLVAGIHVIKYDPKNRGVLIVALPGSPKGAKENLEALLKVLPHALDLATGGSGKTVHESMGVADRGKPISEVLKRTGTAGSLSTASELKAASISAHHQHHHHHHHHGDGHHAPKARTVQSQDPSSVANRQRKSPYPMVSLREAVELILRYTFTMPLQTLPLEESLLGSIIGEDVFAVRNIPERPSTNVDGYAVKITDSPGVYDVISDYPTEPVPSGSIYRINTGAPLPPGADAVIMVEDTQIVSSHDNEEKQVKLLAQVDMGENVRKAGSDVKLGEKVLSEGDAISPVGGELGTLAFVGRRSVKVYRRPTVAVLSTGNELMSILDTPSAHPSTAAFSAIPDSNRPSLLSILKHLHFDTIDLGIIGDTMAETTKALKKGREEADVIISTGGTSMGVGDLLKPCIENELAGTIHFGRVAMKPGKPTTFATLPAHPMAPNQEAKLVFALPGNPASALVTFFIFVLPALRKMEGRKPSAWELPRVPVQLTSNVPLDPRPEYHRVFLRPTLTVNPTELPGISLKAFSTGGQRSSRTVSLAGANGLLELPSSSENDEERKAGEIVNCVVIGEIGSLPV